MDTAPAPASEAPQLIFAARGGAAKTRCAALLSPAERDALTQALLRDVLEAARPYAAWLVTPTRALAAIARAQGASVLLEGEPRGLNGAYAHALAHVRARFPRAPHALLPSDLGFLTSAELAQGLALLEAHEIVLAPTNHGGTGAIFLRAGVGFAPAFGPDSFARHCAQAREGGLSLALLEAPGFARDVDAPEDLLMLARERPLSHAGAFAGYVAPAPIR